MLLYLRKALAARGKDIYYFYSIYRSVTCSAQAQKPGAG